MLVLSEDRTGVHAATSFETFGLPASVRGSLGWHHATGDTDATSTWRFSSGLPFAVEGASIDTNVAVADIGLDLGLSPGSKLALRYSSQIGADSFENNLSARLDIRF
ncbi:autotransporter domain-containing protein [Rhizobium sp. PRIMUS64]|uniref:autotransporter domain-containing protein n=1 Tax=Rhizobium sp. PRIMUS64 TaxID=2908925 RepID=UPI0038D3B157